MEYCIIQPGVFWDRGLEILEETADEGVEVHLIYDELGCMVPLCRG